jgi:predicted nucleic acid-binding protein
VTLTDVGGVAGHIVVDASVVVDLLLRRRAADLYDRLLLEGTMLHAPHLLDLEVVSAIRRFVRLGEISVETGGHAVAGLEVFPLDRHAHARLIARVWRLRDIMSAYDASYVALAEILEAPLVTRDARLARAEGHGAAVELV